MRSSIWLEAIGIHVGDYVIITSCRRKRNLTRFLKILLPVFVYVHTCTRHNSFDVKHNNMLVVTETDGESWFSISQADCQWTVSEWMETKWLQALEITNLRCLVLMAFSNCRERNLTESTFVCV